MLKLRSAIAIAAAICIGASPAVAQYNVYSFAGTLYTDVVVNNLPQSLTQVRAFEQRCGISAAAGRWWADARGNVGPWGRPATYNIRTCQRVSGGTAQVSRDYARNWTQTSSHGRCTFFGTGGSICR
jgi:hypothetical protein